MVGICWGSIFLLKPKKLGNIMTYSLGDPMISWDGTPPRQGTLRNLVVTTISFMVVFNSIRQTTKQTLVNFRWWLMNMFFFLDSTWCYENLFGRDWDIESEWFLHFFCDKFACPICIFFVRDLMFGVDLHFSFACFCIFSFFFACILEARRRIHFCIFSNWKRASETKGIFFVAFFFANLQFPGRTSWASWKNTKNTRICAKKCKNEKQCKTNENSKHRTKTMFLLVILRYFPGFGIFPSFL